MGTSKRQQMKTRAILGAAAAVGVTALLLTVASGKDERVASPPQQITGPVSIPVSSPPPVAKPTPPKPRPHIDVVFALDTTGSMAGLIEGAKVKIWSLANEIASGQPRPIVRFGLVGYRDRGDDYVTKTSALTEDMDAMYQELMAFTAGGGGDTPEDVNRALSDALEKMDWAKSQNTLKLVFLVGDAPPHDDYKDVPTSAELAKHARDRGIIINTVRVGTDGDTEQSWKKIASIAGGNFASIAQSGGMVAVASPYDAELETLNGELAGTSVGYGSAGERTALRGKVSARRAMKAEVAASAASYSSKFDKGGLGAGDLVADIASGRADLDALDEGKMGEDMRAMPEPERKAFVAANIEKRLAIQKKLAKVSKERDAWLKKNASKTGTKDSFDRNVMGAVEEQAAEIGVKF